MYHRVAEQYQAQPLVEKMLRAAALPAKRRYFNATIRSLLNAEVTTQAGIYLGRHPAFRVDAQRIIRTARRYVRGLYRYELGRRVPDGLEIIILPEPESVYAAREVILRLIRGRQIRVVQLGVFWYTWAQAGDCPDASVWILEFFNAFPMVGILRPPRP
jgi:hypothetical protein